MKCLDDSNVELSVFTNNVLVTLLLNALHLSGIEAQVSEKNSSSNFLHAFTPKYVTVLNDGRAMFLLRIQ
jgi:predicted lactoylglutathione lyase